MRKIKLGQLQGGAFTGGELAALDPTIQLYSLPFYMRSLEEVDHVRATLDEVLIERLREQNLEAVGMAGGGFAYIMSSKPARTTEDFKELKVWLPEGDRLSDMAFEAAGLSPVSLPISDVYTGLQTGLLDTVGTTPTGALALQWHTRIKYILDYPVAYVIGILVLDSKPFGKLSAGDQEIVLEAVGGVFAGLETINREDNVAAFEALQNQGIEIIQPSESQEAYWARVRDETVERLLQSDDFDQELLNRFLGLVQEVRDNTTNTNAQVSSGSTP